MPADVVSRLPIVVGFPLTIEKRTPNATDVKRA
jgi:hypothetical protein